MTALELDALPGVTTVGRATGGDFAAARALVDDFARAAGAERAPRALGWDPPFNARAALDAPPFQREGREP